MLPGHCCHSVMMLPACYWIVMLPACCYWSVMMLPVCCYWSVTMLPACCYLSAMMLPACCYGNVMMLPACCYGSVFLWQLDSSHLNLDLSKQKTSLRKKGSLARRKKPSRGSVHNVLPDSPDTIYLDSTGWSLTKACHLLGVSCLCVCVHMCVCMCVCVCVCV